MLQRLKQWMHRCRHVWSGVRELSGDDAYERYLKHHAEFHAISVDAPPPLSQKEFFQQWQDIQWKGTKRCC